MGAAPSVVAFASDVGSFEGTVPSDGTVPSAGTVPSDGTGPSVGTVPSDGTGPSVGTIPSVGAVPSDGAASSVGAVPSDGAGPSVGTPSSDGPIPFTEAPSSTGVSAISSPVPTFSADTSAPPGFDVSSGGKSTTNPSSAKASIPVPAMGDITRLKHSVRDKTLLLRTLNFFIPLFTISSFYFFANTVHKSTNNIVHIEHTIQANLWHSAIHINKSPLFNIHFYQ